MEVTLFSKSIQLMLSLLFIQGLCFSQDSPVVNSKIGNFGIGVQGLAFVSWYDDADEQGNPFDFNDDTRLIGANILVHYYVYDGISLGLGSGVEQITQPDIKYVPVFANVTLSSGKMGDGVHTEVNFGKHYGDLDKGGFMFRAGVGYRFRIHKQLFGYTSLLWTYQNLYKTFEGSQRDNIYNFESVGLLVGVDIN